MARLGGVKVGGAVKDGRQVGGDGARAAHRRARRLQRLVRFLLGEGGVGGDTDKIYNVIDR